MNLLLVEDDPASARDLATVLEAAGHRVDVIRDRGPGLLLPANDLYDAVVADRAVLRLGRLSACTGETASERIAPVLLFGRDADLLDGLDGGDAADQILSEDLTDLSACLRAFSARPLRIAR